MRLQRLGMICILGICSITGIYLLERYWEKESVQISPNAEKPLFTANDVSTTQYNEAGIRNYRLNSKYLEYYKKIDETHFNEPILWTYYQGKDKEWRVTADFAVLRNKRILTMTGHVKIYNLLPDAQITLMTTDELTLDLTTRDFWSEQITEIFGIRTFSRSERVKGNFGSHQMDMIEKVKSTYEAKANNE